MDYNARMYDDLLARFIQPDSIIPGFADPQSWNRYAYVLNNPVNATDPTGHACNGFGHSGYAYQLCKKVYYNGWGNSRGNNSEADPTLSNGFNPTLDNGFYTPQSGAGSICYYCYYGGGNSGSSGNSGGGGNNNCETVTCKAFNGNVGAIVDLLFPTHWGWRVQGELSFDLGAVVPNLSFSVGGGANIVYNRNDGELAANIDWTPSGGAGIGAGGSVTTGPLLGWGSSSVSDVVSGNSGNLSATGAFEGAGTVFVNVPIEGPGIVPHVDTHYGQIPATDYLGVGVGGAYGDISLGKTMSLFHEDLSNLLPSHWSVWK